MSRHRLFSDLPEVLRRSRLGIREALIDHRIAGNPVAVWRDGAVVVAKVDDLALPDDLPDLSSEAAPKTENAKGMLPPE